MNQEQEKFVFYPGAIKSPDDYRNIPLASVMAMPEIVPDSYFVNVADLPVWTQAALGACVGHAGGKYGQRLEKAESGHLVKLSARFLYALAKCVDGEAGQGTYPSVMVKQWQKYGCATEDTCPNDTSLDHETYTYQRKLENIPKAAMDEAKRYAIKSYAFPGVNYQGLQNAIINANGCLLMLDIGQEWWNDVNGQWSWREQDILPLRTPKNVIGSHEVYLYGYDYVGGRLRFWIFNSWSEQWGMQGKGCFFYDEWQPFIRESVTVVDLPNDWIDHVQELPKPNAFRYSFQKPIKYGDRGDEVKALQMALYLDGCLKVDPKVFGNYLGMTAKAVMDFQNKYKVASPQEIQSLQGKSVGPKTRNILNSLFNK